MKKLVSIHAVVAIILWAGVIFSGVQVLPEGGLPAAATLFFMLGITAITVVDMLAIYCARKQKTSAFSVISIVFWALIYLVYLRALLSPNPISDTKLLYGATIAIAMFRVTVSAFMIKLKEDLL